MVQGILWLAWLASQLTGMLPGLEASGLQPGKSQPNLPDPPEKQSPSRLVLSFGLGVYDCLESDASPSFALRLGAGAHWGGLHLSGRFTYYRNTYSDTDHGYDIVKGPFPKVQSGGLASASALYLFLNRSWSPYVGLDIGVGGSKIWSHTYRAPLSTRRIFTGAQLFAGVELLRMSKWKIRWEFGSQLPFYKNWAWVDLYSDGWNEPPTIDMGVDKYMPFVYSMIDLVYY